MSTGREAVESDGLWKAPSELPTGFGNRGPAPFSTATHSSDDDENVLPMSLDESVTYLPGSTGCMLAELSGIEGRTSS